MLPGVLLLPPRPLLDESRGPGKTVIESSAEYNEKAGNKVKPLFNPVNAMP